jgi:hypothetical protein
VAKAFGICTLLDQTSIPTDSNTGFLEGRSFYAGIDPYNYYIDHNSADNVLSVR